METLLGVLGVAVVTGVLGFAYKMVEAYKEQVTFYQQKLLPAVENNTTSVIELKNVIEKAKGANGHS